MTRARIIAVSETTLGLLFANLVVIIGPVYFLPGAALLAFGGLITLVWPSSRIGRTSTLGGALTLAGWTAFVVFVVRLRPPLLYLVVPLAAASLLMALYLARRSGE